MAEKTLTFISGNVYQIMNDSGTIAFRGLFLGGTGVFTQSALAVETGSTVDGKTVEAFTSAVAINNHGTLAVKAHFTDGSSGIVIANPM